MHELSLALNLSDLILEHSDGMAVKEVEIEIGSLSGVMPEAFIFCANLVLAEKFGDQVKVIIHNSTAVAECACGNCYELMDMLSPCPRCGKYEREIVGGQDILLKSLQLEE
jgi:hydrogenase nickel incorporation protein HypA/HybF